MRNSRSERAEAADRRPRRLYSLLLSSAGGQIFSAVSLVTEFPAALNLSAKDLPAERRLSNRCVSLDNQRKTPQSRHK
jgi:hypothetical protein